MTRTLRIAAAGATALLLISGCRKTADNTSNYKDAINTYLSRNPSCLWPQPLRLPVQVSASDTDKTAQYDALYNQGLLQRTASQKKELLGLVDKRVITYDLTANGRNSWTASTTDPSSGNFCYGHREVSSIDQSSATGDKPGATASIVYHYGFTAVAGWAKDPGVQTVFPNVRENLAGGTATATLLDTSNGWQLQAPASPATSNPDSSIVQ